MVPRSAATWVLIGSLLTPLGLWDNGPGSTPATAGRGPAATATIPTVPLTPDFASLGLAPVRVVDVPDGQSLVVQGPKGQEIVALLGVEPAAGSAPGARTAADALRHLATGESVYVVDHEAGPRTDAQGRRAAYVYRAPEGLMLNLELIREGWASARADFAYQHLETFRQWQARAVVAGRGVYAGVPAGGAAPAPSAAPTAPAGASPSAVPASAAPGDASAAVFVTRSGTKYHAQTCRFAKSATQTTLAQAKAKGLEACSQCRPAQ